MLSSAFVYLAAAVLAVPLAKRLGLGSVLGYLLAGVAIGPYGLHLVGEKGAEVMHAAELGVVMMLFLVGLELRPALLWSMRRPILGLGGLQVAATTLVVAAIALALGTPPGVALALGMIASASSTAIVLQSLSERGLMQGEGGQATFAVLLFQDIAVIPMLAILPLLATGDAAQAGAAHGPAAEGPTWLRALLVLGAVGGIAVGGRFLVRPAFRFLAETRLREVFTAAALLLVIGIALLMEKVGLSPALGTFLAGVVLAESEYRHELEGDIEPFKGLLLGLFFISVGATIDFGLIAELPGRIAGLVVALFVVKMAVLAALARGFRLSPTAGWLFTFALSEGGEFAFVLVGFAATSGVFDARLAGTVNAVVALSMLVTPLVLMAHERWIAPRVAGRGAARAADEIPHHANPVVIAGYGRFGQIAGRLIRARGVETVVLDLDASLIDTVGRAGVKVYYGDAARLELLHAAGCARARLFILAVDEVEKSLEIAAMVRKHFPALPIIARARNREHYYGLRKLGIRTIIRETFGSALDAGVAALVELGHRAHQARRLAARFKAHDEETLEKQVALWDDEDETAYFLAARRAREEVAKLLRDDAAYAEEHHDAAWDTESLRAAVREREATPAQEGTGAG